MIKKILAGILVSIGFFLLINGAYSEIAYKRQEEALLEYIDESMDELSNEQSEDLKNENDNLKEEEMNYINEKYNPIGIIEIPTIKLKSGIIKGATLSAIRKGVGYYPNTSLPSEEEGNFVLAAHNSGKMPIFKKLHKVNIGDEIIVTYSNEEYKYIINDKFTVNPTDVDILESREGIKEITLFTCTNKGKQRLVVRGVCIN